MNAKMAALTGLLAVGYILPAASDPFCVVHDFYVVHDPSSKHCSIVDERPIAKQITVLTPDGFASRTDAETAMHTVRICD